MVITDLGHAGRVSVSAIKYNTFWANSKIFLNRKKTLYIWSGNHANELKQNIMPKFESYYGRYRACLLDFGCLSVPELYSKANLQRFVGLNTLYAYLKVDGYKNISDAMKDNIDILLHEAKKKMEETA